MGLCYSSTCLLWLNFFFFTQENLNFSDPPVSTEGLRPDFPYCWVLSKSFKASAFWPLRSRMKIISTCTVVVLSMYPSVLTSSPPLLEAFSPPCSPLPRGAVGVSPLCLSVLCTARLSTFFSDESHCWPVSSSRQRNLSYRTGLREEQ